MTTTCSHRTSHLTLTSDDVAGHYSGRASSSVGRSALQHYSATWPLQHYSTTGTTGTILYSTLHHPSGKCVPSLYRQGNEEGPPRFLTPAGCLQLHSCHYRTVHPLPLSEVNSREF